MNKIELDFNLESTTPQVFWNITYEWISSYKLLTPAVRSEFALKNMYLSNFAVTLPGKHDGKVLVDVYHDTFAKKIEITVEYKRATTNKTIEILFDYLDATWFSYKEIVEKGGNEEIDVPDFLDYVKHLILPENEMFEVLAVVDENNGFKQSITNLTLHYKGFAKVSLTNMEQCKGIPTSRDKIIPGETLILKSGRYASVFAQKNIHRLDWYILSRSNNKWRVKERFLRNHPRDVFLVRKAITA